MIVWIICYDNIAQFDPQNHYMHIICILKFQRENNEVQEGMVGNLTFLLTYRIYDRILKFVSLVGGKLKPDDDVFYMLLSTYLSAYLPAGTTDTSLLNIAL